MTTFLACLAAELLKIRKSKVLPATAIAFSVAPVMGALFVLVLRDPSLSATNPALAAKAEMTGFTPDWPSFLHLIGQAIGVGGVIVFGFVASWVFGREFADHTAKDLLVLPVSRAVIVFSKLAAILAWCLFLSLFVLAVALALGSLLQLPAWSPDNFIHALAVIAVTTILVTFLCPPVAFIASVGRGYLAPLGFVVLMIVVAQIISALGFGAHFPWAIPALYSQLTTAPSGIDAWSYAILFMTCLAGVFATVYWWTYADQTK
ncbi:MAG TPA: ABC transporter permease [Bacillales bacterium]|nr:ABC transporter permease [Bacillales bacterium]